MRNILLLDTSVGSTNQGDEIIIKSIHKYWKEIFDRNYIMRIATHTPMFSFVQQSFCKKRLAVFADADYKFLCGTNALYTNMIRPMPSWNINLLDCKLAEGTICVGAGIGINSKKTNLYTRYLYDRVLNHDYIHSVRDEKTKEFLEKLGFKAENTGCPTLWGLTQNHCRNIPEIKGDKVVFTLTNYTSDPENDSLMVRILLNNYETVYFWPQCFKDLEYLKRICDTSKIQIISPNLSGYEKVLEQDNTDYVGNRLHGGIYAMQHKCRTIIISIDYRALEMSKSYTFPCIDRDSIGTKLEQMINSEWRTEVSGIDFDKITKWKGQFDLG